ncbi:hypothetical protein HAT86_06040 [Roseovarius gahaiensis]|uniref:Peptidase inhibitor I78 family protein n=1 Tax=Roseovarius gahaiensis TaxID=2716691 RepID=A0A967EFN7_9RHOB|nr:I78 family peptidase inhibitor [Roseovarius gahaiensis]NHQ74026.1 hypothetical protein [Roseovarius gahaiensis]
MKHVLFVLSTMALAGCNTTNEGPADDTDTCEAERLQHWVGQPRNAFDAEAIDGPVRILPPGAMMTMDYRLDRLNVDLSKDGQITRIWCG